jgi:tetratricopeptide (TPR) repeat protein
MLRSFFAGLGNQRWQRSLAAALGDAVHARDEGRLDEAELCVREALRLDAAHVESHLLLADVLSRNGKHVEAARTARSAIGFSPDRAEAHEVYATVLRAGGDLEGACAALLETLKCQPARVKARADLAVLLIERRRYADAIGVLRRLVKQRPELAEAQGNLGIALSLAGRPEKALLHFAEAVRLKPEDPLLLGNQGLCLRELDRLEDAEAVLKRAAAIAGAGVSVHVNFANVLRDLGRPREALDQIEALVRARPATADARVCLARLLQEVGDIERAANEFDAAVALQPTSANARFSRAMFRLASGDFERGWPEYEARTETHESPLRGFRFPRWVGGSFSGKSVLVYAEQGLGDEIMFASCIPDLIAEARQCVIDCDPRLERLFRLSFPSAEVHGGPHVAEPSWLTEAGEIEVTVPAGSLPGRFRPTQTKFPQHSGYLRADTERVSAYRGQLAALGDGLKVGLTWRGGLGKTRRAVRSVPVDGWLPLLSRVNAHFISLQHGPVEADLAAFEQLPCAPRIYHWADVQADCAELAALISALDLVVSVCNASVHLGGALGKPVLALVPHSPEWRYLFKGNRMPWYPSVRLFRQTEAGNWKPVLDEVAVEIERLQRAGSQC